MEQNVLEQILEGSMKPTHLPLETLRKITDEFSTDRIIGEGGFGTVYKGVVGNEIVAVKRIRSSMTINQKLFRREVDSQMDINHENVVRFLGLCSHTVETPMKNPESPGYIYAEIRERLLCFEYVSNGSLDKYITDELRGLEWDTRYQIIKGICAGLHYLHMEKSILHMDLKPTNILLDDHMGPKITDFGLSRPLESPQTMTTNHFTSLGYGAPENLFGRGTMSVKSDMYSLGAIIVELVTGRKGIPDNNNDILRRWRHRWNKSANETPPEYHQQVTDCIEIGSLCLNTDPYLRPSISEIMSKFVEMDSTKMNPLYLDDDMLGVEPLELHFRYNKKHILSCSVELSNHTDGYIAFKIETTSPLPYSIEPDKDIVKPRSKCSVDITLPIADTDDHMAALQYTSTGNKQPTKVFIVKSIKVNECLTSNNINQDMFDMHRAGHNVDEIDLTVVFSSKENLAEEEIYFRSKQSEKQYTSSGTNLTPAPTEPRNLEVVMKSKENAPLLGHYTKVLVKLTGGDCNRDRPGLDLVVVVDVTGRGMQDDMLRALKIAMRFVVGKLSPVDRLAIIASAASSTLLCPLRQVTEASQREMVELIDRLEDLRSWDVDININEALRHALKVLDNRKVSAGRVVGIMLVSHNPKVTHERDNVHVSNVAVYTFGFDLDSSRTGKGCSWVLNNIAAGSMGGTFSHILVTEDGRELTMAFSQCLAGLLTVSAQDLELTVAPVANDSRIAKVNAGSYPQWKQKDDDNSPRPGGAVTIGFGDLYGGETRNIIVDLWLPAIVSERRAEILKVTYSYSSSSSSAARLAPPETLTVQRTGSRLKEKNPAELQMEEARLKMVDLIREAIRMPPDMWDTPGRDSKLWQAMSAAKNAIHRAEAYQLCKLDGRGSYDWEWEGCHYASSSQTSHGWQRYAARGIDIETMRLFATTRMDMYLEQAKKFHREPTMVLPTEDDDLKEELAINAAKVAALALQVAEDARAHQAGPGAASRRARFCCWC